jgi:hypothetical protein
MTPPAPETNRKTDATASKGKGPIRGDKAPSTLAFLLSQVGIFASRRFAERLAAIDLQPPLFRVLNVVDAAEGLSQQAIGEAIHAPASRMVAIVDGSTLSTSPIAAGSCSPAAARLRPSTRPS